MIDLGQLRCYVGINLNFTTEGMFLFQKLYKKNMVQTFGIINLILTKGQL
jgi:hypothetical protein